MKKEKQEQTSIIRPSCKMCGVLNIRCRVNGTYFCKSCGYDSKVESGAVLKFKGEVPAGFYSVDGYTAQGRTIPPHLRKVKTIEKPEAKKNAV